MKGQKETEYPAELAAVLERAGQGDTTVLPELCAALDRYPELAQVLGDMAQHAEDALLRLAAGTCLTAREAIKHQLAALRERLNASAGCELERLLIRQLALDWLALHHAQLAATAQLQKSATGPVARDALHRLDRAHARFLAASKTLASVQRLLRRAPSPIDLLRPTHEGPVQASAGRAGRRQELEAALN
jgi:hypothetical protein